MALLTIMTRFAVLVAGTAVLLALQAFASPSGLSHEPRLRPPRKHQPCDRSFFAYVLPRGAALENVTVVRDGDSYGEGEANVAYPKNPTHLPPLCAVTVRVKSSATSSYRFGLFLPDEWNSRFLVVGNGGFAGGINWLDMAAGPRYGMASLSTDTGHSSKTTNTTWARNQPEKKADWGWRAMHGSTVLGKKLVRAYYTQQRLSYSYYSGCSTGGRQGLKELQNFPDSFDGALIGAAAWWTSHLNTYVTQAGLYNLPETDPKHLDDDDVALIADEVTRQCDGLDGVEDSIISSPDLCQPNLDTLLCPTTNNNPDPNPNTDDNNPPKCLSRAQLTTAHNLYSDYRSPTTNEFLHPGLTPGSEPQWYVLINGSEPSPYGVGYARDFLFDTTNPPTDPSKNTTTWDWRTFNETVLHHAETHDPGRATADDYAALAAVRRRGGKVLLYHGTGDGLVPTKDTELYYRRTVEALRAGRRWWWWGWPGSGSLGGLWRWVWGSEKPGGGEGGEGGEGGVDGDGEDDGGVGDFLNMFLVPGMQHCAGTEADAPWSFGAASQAGALGNDTWSVPGFEDARHDALLALVDWVEEGRPVEQLVATTWEDPTDPASGVKRQRPICAWPRRAVWDGRGDVDDADSWWCSR